MSLTQPFIPPEPARNRPLVATWATGWGYVRHELLYLAFALMEIALSTPVVLVILGWARYWPPYLVSLWLLLIMLLPLNLIRLTSLLHVSLRRQRWVMAVALFLTIFLSWRLLLHGTSSAFDFGWLREFARSLGEENNLLWTRDLSVFIITAFFWWRGIRLVIRRPGLNNTGLRMRLGGLIFLPLIIWFAGNFLVMSIVPFILLFFLSSLTVISLVRAENIEQDRSGSSATLNMRWFATVAAAALAIVIAGGIFTMLLTGDSLFVVVAWLAPLWRAMQFTATVSGTILFELTYPLLEVVAKFALILTNLLAGLMGQISVTLGVSNLLDSPIIPELPASEETAGIILPPIVGKATTAAIMLGLLFLIALALARTYRKATFATRDSDRSRTSSRDEHGPNFGRRLLGRFGDFRQWRAAASVRRIYRLMCRAADEAGFPRLDSETPYEYLVTLAKAWPEHTRETRLITEAFIRVRYGEVPETGAELEAIQAAWRTLETAEIRHVTEADGQLPVLTKRE